MENFQIFEPCLQVPGNYYTFRQFRRNFDIRVTVLKLTVFAFLQLLQELTSSLDISRERQLLRHRTFHIPHRERREVSVIISFSRGPFLWFHTTDPVVCRTQGDWEWPRNQEQVEGGGLAGPLEILESCQQSGHKEMESRINNTTHRNKK